MAPTSHSSMTLTGDLPAATRGAGALFLAAFLLYGGGSSVVEMLLQDASALGPAAVLKLRLGALSMIANSAVVIAIGALLSATVRPFAPRIGALYLAVRVFEGTMLAVGVVSILLVPAAGAAPETIRLLYGANEIAFTIAMGVLGAGSVPLLWALGKHGAIPRWLAGWGIVGYAAFSMGAALELSGVPVLLFTAAPSGLFEVAFAFWLMLRGLPLRDAPTGVRQP